MELGLSQNRLTRIPDGTFDTLTQLHYLYLDENQIPMVTESTFGAATRQRLRHLDLSSNPFNCSADLREFAVSWFSVCAGLRCPSVRHRT
nr:hypothetical protein BaRGS_021175 [Batillaria attramentaria]